MEKQVLTGNTAEVYFAKVVATPTPLLWSQIYNAGSLFAVLSLQYKEISDSETPLAVIGKDVFASLEEEYFTLETKSFLTIKDAIQKSLEKVPPSTSASFLIAAIPPGKDQLLYVYLIGSGSILLKRGDKVGTLLQPSEDFQSASGILQDKDMVILQTAEFQQAVPHEILVSSLNLPPTDAIEVFSAKIHQGEMGKEAALLLSYQKKQPEEIPLAPSFAINQIQETQEEEETNEDLSSFTIAPTIPQEPTPTPPAFNSPSLLTRLQAILPLKNISFPQGAMQLNHTRKLYLTIAAVLLAALLMSGYLAVQRQQDAKNQEEVAQIIEEAEKRYNEGEVLAGLNKNLAREDFEEAKTILEEGKGKFKKGSPQEKQIDEFLVKVNAALSGSSDATTVTPQEVTDSTSPLLAAIKSKNATFATTYESSVYYITNSGISSSARNGGNEKKLIDKDFGKNHAGIGIFGANIYLLEKTDNQIYKFVPSGSTYSKSNYLTTEANFSQAVSMSIDGSVWVLFSDGTIKKYTKGKEDSFSLTGLSKPLSNPTRIITPEDSDTLYILDPANNRIVSISKSGTYQAQYQADIIKSAKDFDINESSEKAYVLSNNKVYELPLH